MLHLSPNNHDFCRFFWNIYFFCQRISNCPRKQDKKKHTQTHTAKPKKTKYWGDSYLKPNVFILSFLVFWLQIGFCVSFLSFQKSERKKKTKHKTQK